MDIQQQIDQVVRENDLVLFMKGTPDFPQCGFSGRAVQILTTLEAKFVGVNVLDSDEVREGVKSYSNWPTIPQLYASGEFIGGSDILMEMYESGELQELLSQLSAQTQIEMPEKVPDNSA